VAPETHVHEAGWLVQDLGEERHGGRLPGKVSH
jgi:hypothetical protein